MKAFLTPKDILALPSFDAVICTSVVHHVIRQNGLAVGEDFVRALATRANKLVLFEMELPGGGLVNNSSGNAARPGGIRARSFGKMWTCQH